MPVPTRAKTTKNRALTVAVALDDRPGYLIAGLARVSAQQLSGYCSGRMPIPPAHAERLAKVLGITVADILEGSA